MDLRWQCLELYLWGLLQGWLWGLGWSWRLRALLWYWICRVFLLDRLDCSLEVLDLLDLLENCLLFLITCVCANFGRIEHEWKSYNRLLLLLYYWLCKHLVLQEHDRIIVLRLRSFRQNWRGSTDLMHRWGDHIMMGSATWRRQGAGMGHIDAFGHPNAELMFYRQACLSTINEAVHPRVVSFSRLLL